jgi:hypothetical protein
MEARKALTIEEFCDEQHFSRGTYYNLKKLGRGPVETRCGRVVTISPYNAWAWRKNVQDNPIVGGLLSATRKARIEPDA